MTRTLDFLLGEAPAQGLGKPREGYNTLDRPCSCSRPGADAQQLPGLAFLRALAAVTHSTGRITNTALGTVDPTRGDLRCTNVFIARATSFPNAQKVPALVATLLGELRERTLTVATLREPLELAFKAHQRLVSIQ